MQTHCQYHRIFSSCFALPFLNLPCLPVSPASDFLGVSAADTRKILTHFSGNQIQALWPVEVKYPIDSRH